MRLIHKTKRGHHTDRALGTTVSLFPFLLMERAVLAPSVGETLAPLAVFGLSGATDFLCRCLSPDWLPGCFSLSRLPGRFLFRFANQSSSILSLDTSKNTPVESLSRKKTSIII